MLGVTKVRFRTEGELEEEASEGAERAFFCGEEGMGEEGEEKSFDGPERPRPEGGGRVGRVRRGMSRGFSTKSMQVTPLKRKAIVEEGLVVAFFSFGFPTPVRVWLAKKLERGAGTGARPPRQKQRN